jgi:hypothetical protein
MELFKRGENIGKVLAGRVKDFPTFLKEPKKKPARWAVCPDFTVRPPRVVSKEASEKNYRFSVLIYSSDREDCLEMLDHMIRCGQEEIESGNKRFWLYAVKHSIRQSGLFQAELTYIFRVRQVPEEIL